LTIPRCVLYPDAQSSGGITLTINALRAAMVALTCLCLAGCLSSADGGGFQPVQPAAGQGTLYVYQGNINGASDVLVDGVVVGKVDRNGYWAGSVAPGPHKVSLKQQKMFLPREKGIDIVVAAGASSYVKNTVRVDGVSVGAMPIWTTIVVEVPESVGSAEIAKTRGF
jgi:hypothetical protein